MALRQHLGLMVVGLLTLGYTVLFSCASIARWQSCNGTLFDLGIMIQTWYNTSHGRLLEESVNLGIPVSRFWLAHWEFIYIPLALVYKLVPRVETLLVLQSLFLAMGALPVYWLARERLSNQPAGVVFAAAYLLYPAMQNTNLFDVHGIVFSTSLILYAFYFLDKKRTGWFLFFAFLALLCREDIAILWGMTGAYLVLIRKQAKLGILLIVFATIWFGVFYFGQALIVKHFAPRVYEAAQTITRPSHWAYLKGGKLILENPIYFLDEHFLTKLNAKYLTWLFAPVAFLSLASPCFLAIASPVLLINMTSDWYPAHVIEYPYTATLTPIIFVSAIYGLASLLEKFQKRGTGEGRSRRLLQMILTVVLISSVAAGIAKSNLRNINEWQRTPHHEVVARVAAMIPETASLSVDTFLGSHAAERRELYAFPDKIDSVDYILYDFSNREFRLMTRDSFFLPPAKPVNEHIWRVMTNPSYGVLHYEHGVALFQRGYDHHAGLRNLAIAKSSEIENPMNIAVNDTVMFLGYTPHVNTRFWNTFYYHFTLYWTVTKPSSNRDPARFLLGNAETGFHSPHNPAFGLYPRFHWQPGEIIREEVYWEIRPGFMPGNINVSLQFENNPVSVRLFNF
ncbi:MAG: DUF2079 domain-containing protein [candidate division KSB1 bacterium]|nr:DUF2079 domain-containing protein [candidate division KSB1 bacterium]MDZ7305325.1 DUF2079 domain-containing protein [candidate division KSB1 bacterium]